ncbi:GNAT family acetyltransferase [Mycetocola tolaasinivorans]|uniref:GNAT family acetyltransferase n=1 Tax=Mycetocola tolaasinivorans TaxID=76635 RepID=A0A3L7AC40_9MICO|nr:GNAT family acetyltransferase [Mycetocola tolaasinivorans]RLP77565.1 GNAT family acetyltransferase [Mycetocola tolaasinivorans]
MNVAPITPDLIPAAAALWHEAGLTRPWNDPMADAERALAGATSSVLGLVEDGILRATAMVGEDGHRGWIYYVAVREADRGRGLGRVIIEAAERWLAEAGAVKVQLMVRDTNTAVIDFYERLGYEDAEVAVLGKWLVTV